MAICNFDGVGILLSLYREGQFIVVCSEARELNIGLCHRQVALLVAAVYRESSGRFVVDSPGGVLF